MNRSNPPKNKGFDKVTFWLQRIEKILDNSKISKYKKQSMRKIRDTIAETDNVTDKQVRAIKNLQFGKNPITND